MGLKFRRGTNAQKSGSLAFGEPYVNTDLGTLQIGGATGDITLGASGTGSQGTFSGISGSSLDITGNAKIDGNLTLGGAITIGDATADTVNVVASLSSSLIPQTTNAFDLGSATKIWRDLYISTGSIKFVAGTTVVKELTLSTLTALETATGSSNVSITNLNTATASLNTSVTNLNSTTASLNTSVTNINLTTASLNTSVSNLNTATSSYETKGRGIVSGSAQIDGSLLGSNKTITIGSTSTTLGGTSTTLAGLTSVTSTAFVGALTGNASTVTTNANLTGNVTSVGNATTIASGVVTSDMIVDGTIVNGDINASAAIVDTKLATISTGGKVSNSATTATSANTVSAIVARDGSGNFSAGTITAALTGNASTATTAAALTTARTINGTSFDGSANITIPNLVSGSAQVTLSSTTGGGTASNVQFNSLGIGMAASATAGRIDASNDVVAFSTSDIRFKENIVPIENALDKISKISGNTYDWKVELKDVHGYEGNDVGVIAQEIEAVLPQLVQDRDNGYKAVKYDKLVALLIEGIKEQQTQIHSLTIEIEKLKESKGL